jgi:hypothetical protein
MQKLGKIKEEKEVVKNGFLKISYLLLTFMERPYEEPGA